MVYVISTVHEVLTFTHNYFLQTTRSTLCVLYDCEHVDNFGWPITGHSKIEHIDIGSRPVPKHCSPTDSTIGDWNTWHHIAEILACYPLIMPPKHGWLKYSEPNEILVQFHTKIKRRPSFLFQKDNYQYIRQKLTIYLNSVNLNRLRKHKYIHTFYRSLIHICFNLLQWMQLHVLDIW